MDNCIFTETLDWLAFTVPQATVDEIGPVVRGEWFETTTGFRGYPTCWLTTQGRQGVGKLGTGAPRNRKEVHVDLSGGIVSSWDEAKIRSVLTCCDCDSEFTFLPKTRSLGRAIGSEISLTRHLNQEDRIMMVKAEGSVQGYVERKGKENRVYRSMNLYVKGKNPGNLRLNIPEEHHHLIEVCKQSEGKQARAAVEIRKFELTGKIFFDLVALEILK